MENNETNFEKIERYLSQAMSAEARRQFEVEISDNKELANDLAFVLQAKQAAHILVDEQRKADFATIAQRLDKPVKPFAALAQPKYWVAAASVALVAGFLWYFNSKPNTQQLADAYIEKAEKLPVMMGADTDSLQIGVVFYNGKQYEKAQDVFGRLANRLPKALEYQGLAALQLKQYDQAIEYFRLLSQSQIYHSRGLLLEALTWTKKGDSEKCNELLRAINPKELSLEDREFVEELKKSN